MFEKKAVILTTGDFGTLRGKTANDLVMYSRRYQIVAVIDETKVGRDAGEALGIGKKGIPIVGNLQDSLRYDPEALIIGTAPVGGILPPAWRAAVNAAISHRMDVINGLHQFFSEDHEFSEAANKYKVNILDIRKPPADVKEQVFTGRIRKIDIPVVAILSTDLCAGKNIALIELMSEAERRGFNPGLVATGQTMIMIGADAGVVVDALPADFMVGALEREILNVAKKDKDMIFVEGQAAISHPWAGVETLAVIYASWPDAVILVHNPFLEKRAFFPEFDMPRPSDEIKKIETVFPETRVVGVAVNGFMKSDEEIRAACERIRAETGLPATDCYRFGAAVLFDALILHLKTVRKKLSLAQPPSL